MKLPIYELHIKDEGSQVEFVALVDKPAIEKDFMVFSGFQKFDIVNEEQRIISGPLMVAEQLIYRNMPGIGEHYVKFSATTIRDIAIKFARKGFQNNVNLMHSEDLQVKGVTLFESFISDTKRGIKPMKGYEDLPEGSWFGSMFVEDDITWQIVKEGKARGFSVEGVFEYQFNNEPITADDMLEQLSQLLSRPIVN